MTSLKRRPALPILIVEDLEENQMLLAGICSQMQVPFKIAGNGQEALDLCAKESFSVFLVDLMMPVMDGKTFIKLIKEKIPDSVILVQTALDGSEQIIEIMRMGVYDYIIKPLHMELFRQTLEQSLEYRYLKDIEKKLLLEESKELRDQLEWLNYKETSRKTSNNSVEMNSIFNLKTTLSQGSGFGSMTTIIDSIKSMLTPAQDNYYKIDKDLFDLLLENNHHTKSMIRGLEHAVVQLDKKLELLQTQSSDIIQEIPGVITSLESHIHKKGLKTNLPIFKGDIALSADMPALKIILKELLLNAIKYAPPNSNIDIFVTLVEGYFCLSIKNKIVDDSYGNISSDIQKNLILPFFRIHPPVEEVHEDEPFSLGLGLTIVDYIANKHHGMFFIRNATDHTSEETSLCVLAELFLPIQNKKKEKT
ncbi:response regulator [Leptospira sp. 'Mane']|uniref:ATP-binding response regulator n=1 Tax=Leptospira sp. 'Mane' TaxID=3387407 RepID=UPI00398AFCE0